MKPRMLVACEYTATVRQAFAALGWDAWSCDLLPTEVPGNHYQCDVREVLNLGWDLIIAHPPCNYLSSAGGHLWHRRTNEIAEAFAFIKMLWAADTPHLCLENPVGWLNPNWKAATQLIHPYYFGDPYYKRTCLWLRGLPPLWYVLQDTLFESKTAVKPTGFWISSSSNVKSKLHGKPDYRPGYRNARDRARFFPSVAKAMATQWTACLT